MLRTQANKLISNASVTSSGPPSAGIPVEPFEIIVEITPPGIPETMSNSNSFSLDSNVNLNITIPEYHSRSSSISPQQRKMSELMPEGFLNPANFSRINSVGSGGSVNRLFRRLEDMIDLSFPYNHYKCLSPSESNLAQCTDQKMQCILNKFEGNKPGSSRLLRRQFSLDREDSCAKENQTSTFDDKTDNTNSIIASNFDQFNASAVLTSSSLSSKTQISPRIPKQNSVSVAQDLEKIEEIPVSPSSVTHENSPSSQIINANPISIAIVNEKLDIEMNSLTSISVAAAAAAATITSSPSSSSSTATTIINRDGVGGGVGESNCEQHDYSFHEKKIAAPSTTATTTTTNATTTKNEVKLNVETLLMR